MHARRIAPRRPIPPAPGFTRRHRRIAVRCAATIADGRRAVPGETMDVGGGGAAFLVDAWIPPFTPVSVLLRPPGAPAGARPALTGQVRSAAFADPAPTGAPRYRLGVAFDPPSPVARAWLAEAVPAIADAALGPELARSPSGRELLYQATLERMAGAAFRAARVLAGWLHAADALDLRYQALLRRAAASERLGALAPAAPEDA